MNIHVVTLHNRFWHKQTFPSIATSNCLETSTKTATSTEAALQQRSRTSITAVTERDDVTVTVARGGAALLL